MTRRVMLFTWLCALVALSVNAVPAIAHPGHDHKVLGTVVSVTANRLVVKDRQN